MAELTVTEAGNSKDSMMQRIMRSSVFTIIGFGLSQAIRFGSNLILARLLFPEAFGTMALVSVLMAGLFMLSDLGIQPAIQSSERGDEPNFLNTAWSLNIIRSVVLFIAACGLAWPMAWFYEEPQLMYLVPVTATGILLLALEPTRAETASRHMMLGRVTQLEIASQVISVAAMLILAYLTQSIWALVAGNVIASGARAALAWVMLPGISNRWHLERQSVKELITYGRWIFFSTIAGFIVLQSDKLILGHFLDLSDLGLYNIGSFLAAFPMMVGMMLTQRLMIPIYRESPPGESEENFKRLRRIRAMLSLFLILGFAPLALLGVWIVDFLYDDRYAIAGLVTVVVALSYLPQTVGLTYDQVTLASGDSRGFFMLNAFRALLLIVLQLSLVARYGIAGAPISYALATLFSYPMQVVLARRYGAWDIKHDIIMFTISGALVWGIWQVHGEALTAFLGL